MTDLMPDSGGSIVQTGVIETTRHAAVAKQTIKVLAVIGGNHIESNRVYTRIGVKETETGDFDRVPCFSVQKIRVREEAKVDDVHREEADCKQQHARLYIIFRLIDYK